jgi:hypothetical protein
MTSETMLPDTTIVIEWENAIDVEDHWTKRAMSTFVEELRSTHNRFAAPVTVMYTYDSNAVDEKTIRDTIAATAPEIVDYATLELVPTDGLSYYQLKNFGAQRASTSITVFLDSDAGPVKGWLSAMLTPFADPEVQVVAGFTALGHQDIQSKTMALSWIMKLPSEKNDPIKRRKMYPNNCAVRSDFFKQNPFPELAGAFKKACGIWQIAMLKRGVKFAYAPDATTIHAPHPPGKFIYWRAWATGVDRDYKCYQLRTRSRIGRLAYAFYWFIYKLGRSWFRILFKGGEVELPLWQRPGAMAYAFAFFLTMLAGQLWSAVSASPKPLPETMLPPRTASA